MSKNQCFKIKRGTDYDKAVKEHFSLLPKWNKMIPKVAELLAEDITRIAFVTDQLYIDVNELKDEESKKLFTSDGKLKQNTKKSKQLLVDYKETVEEVGLKEFQELRLINFAYGVLRLRGQNMESFVTTDDDIYYKTNFNLEERSNGLVEPITEIEYEEKYLEELKNKESVTS